MTARSELCGAGAPSRGAQLPARARPTCRPPTQSRKWECPRPPRAALARAPNGPRRSRMRRCRCTGASDIGRAHPGGRRGVRSFTPGRWPPDCTTATRSPPHPSYPAAPGASPAANDRLYIRWRQLASRPTSMRARSPLGDVMQLS